MEEKPELQEKLNEMAKENSIDFNEKIITELNNAGFEISMDDLKEPSGELSEDELNEYKEDFESDFGDYGKNITEGYSVATTLSYSYKGADFSYKVNFIICKSILWNN